MVVARTTTATAVYSQPPRSVHIGATVRDLSYIEAQFHPTVSSAILLAKLPAHCLILDAMLKGNRDAAVTAGQLEVRVNNVSIGTFTVSDIAAGWRPAGSALPLKISLSDDAMPRYVELKMQVTTAGTASVSLSLSGWISYLVGSDV